MLAVLQTAAAAAVPWQSQWGDAVFARAAELVLRDARGFGHNTFKIELAKRVIVATLSELATSRVRS